MKELLEYILQFGNLNEQQIGLLSSKATEIALQKGEYFLEAGHVCRQVGFLLEGVLRVCYYNNKGEEITRYFLDEQHLVVELKSFEYGVASSEYVQAVTDCQLIVFSKQGWEELAHTIVGWEAIVHKMTSKILLQKLERIGPLVAQDATTRYVTFLEKYPRIANRVPLAYLASYLGITQSSLSRIRRNIR